MNHLDNNSPKVKPLNPTIFSQFMAIFLLLILGGFVSVRSENLKNQTGNNTDQINFYGNNNSRNQSGADYLVFRENNNQIKGLIFVQDSDVFSCINGVYNRQTNQIENVIFSYPDIETGSWETYQDQEPLNLDDFPYQFSYQNLEESANNLFLDCLTR